MSVLTKRWLETKDINVYFIHLIEKGENTTAGCFRNKNVLKLEAGMLEKIRTF